MAENGGTNWWRRQPRGTKVAIVAVAVVVLVVIVYLFVPGQRPPEELPVAPDEAQETEGPGEEQ
jgi:hypothetical protein